MMKYGRHLPRFALLFALTAALSVNAFAADYDFETGMDTEYYPSTSDEDAYGSAYNYGGPNLVDYQIPVSGPGIGGVFLQPVEPAHILRIAHRLECAHILSAGKNIRAVQLHIDPRHRSGHVFRLVQL